MKLLPACDSSSRVHVISSQRPRVQPRASKDPASSACYQLRSTVHDQPPSPRNSRSDLPDSRLHPSMPRSSECSSSSREHHPNPSINPPHPMLPNRFCEAFQHPQIFHVVRGPASIPNLSFRPLLSRPSSSVRIPSSTATEDPASKHPLAIERAQASDPSALHAS